MAKTPRWRGVKAITEAENSPEWEFSTGGTTCVRTFNGPYKLLLSKRPIIGQSMADIDAAMEVEKVAIKCLNVGAGDNSPGTMTVNLISILPPEATATAFQPVYEIEWHMLERKIEQHPVFQEGGALALFLSDTEPDDYDQLSLWESAQTKTDKQKAKDAMTDNCKKLLEKKKKGEDSYRLYYPVARKTSQVRQLPTIAQCGMIDTPDFPGLPDGYEWLKSADRGTRTGRFGKWEEQEEWDGADTWDADLYTSVLHG